MGQMRNAYRPLVEKSRMVERDGNRWGDNVKIDVLDGLD
jgi:hypothetical protein